MTYLPDKTADETFDKLIKKYGESKLLYMLIEEMSDELYEKYMEDFKNIYLEDECDEDDNN